MCGCSTRVQDEKRPKRKKNNKKNRKRKKKEMGTLKKNQRVPSYHQRGHLLLTSPAKTTGFMRFCSKSVVFVFNVGVVLSVCHGCFLPGALSHGAPRGAGLHHQLPAETGREVHHLLPAQLRQARLLQGQAGGISFRLPMR